MTKDELARMVSILTLRRIATVGLSLSSVPNFSFKLTFLSGY